MTRTIGARDVEVAVDGRAETGEGPLWDPGSDRLYWVDIPRGLIHRWHQGSAQPSSLEVGQPVGAIALREAGGLIAAVRDGFGFIQTERGELDLRCPVEFERPNSRMNDGQCDSAGRFWAGTMDSDMSEGAGSLYRLDPDLTVTTVIEGVSVSNGIGWSLDDRSMYYIDSLTHRVDIFDFDADEGDIRNRRSLIEIPAEQGLPDGMAVDSEGCLWVALWDGWSVRRYTPDGQLDTVVELPTAQITSCAFGGADLDELYITSAAAGLSESELADQPHAGAVFHVRPGAAGLPIHGFAG